MKQYATELKEGMMTQPLFNALAYSNSALLHLDDCLPMAVNDDSQFRMMHNQLPYARASRITVERNLRQESEWEIVFQVQGTL